MIVNKPAYQTLEQPTIQQGHHDEVKAISKLVHLKFSRLIKREKNPLKKLVLTMKRYAELKKVKAQVTSSDNLYSIY
ncbi:hypothetical protein [Aridibaculum aurantiacum]|uniref:hypothetical protein n=1 Tax=Aridibaculum aurantiacum TaxID=2810307 RepID=UPI001A973FBE|nr:hypothetical protein [Aridibaculum aurantiacum]